MNPQIPIILRKQDETTWLDRSVQDVKLLQSLIEKPYPDDEMRVYPLV